MRGWLVVRASSDIVPEIVHIVPTEDRETIANGHVLHALCYCRPRRITAPLDDIALSHNEMTWPGARTDVATWH